MGARPPGPVPGDAAGHRDDTPAGGAPDDRLSAVAALLRRHGITARVDAAGPNDEIAAIAAPVSELEPLRELAPRVKAIGFEYVALELADAPMER